MITLSLHLAQRIKGTTNMVTPKHTSASSITSKPERLAPKGNRTKTLSTRDYFAGQALGALISMGGGAEHQRADIKKEAYRWADFMIEE